MNLCKIRLGFDEFASIKSTSGYDPVFRFSDQYINFITRFPSVCDNLDAARPIAFVIEFHKERDVMETHSFFVSARSIDHFELRGSKIDEDLLSWLIVDVLKRMGVERSMSSVETTSFSVRDDLTAAQLGLLLELVVTFRTNKKSQSAIFKKLQQRHLPDLLKDFGKRGLLAWSRRSR